MAWFLIQRSSSGMGWDGPERRLRPQVQLTSTSTSPQIPGIYPQIRAPAPKSRCKPQTRLPLAGPVLAPWPRGRECALPARRAPCQARSREHAPRSKLPPRAAPRPIAPRQPMAAEEGTPLTNRNAEGGAAGYKTRSTTPLRPVPGWAGPVAN